MTLYVWLDGVHLGQVTETRGGQLRLTFESEVVAEWPGAPWLSCSLPVSRRPQDAKLFLAGLLPEGDHRRRMAELADVMPYDVHGLLARFGRDVAGAVVVTTDDTPPQDRPGHLEPLDDDELAREVDVLPNRVLGLRDDSELSLDGLQDKMTLAPDGDGWARPVEGRPSTHILKLDDRRHQGLVVAEAVCLRLGAAVGVTTVTAETRTFGEIDTIIVSRFDRTTGPGGVRRLHQEDACQALGRDPNRMYEGQPMGKYQIAGGPSFVEIAGLLKAHAADATRELDRLHALMVFTTAIGNADAHGKNVGILHPAPDTIELAPAYDTVPTVLWPTLRTRPAMFVNGRDELDAITGDDLAIEASKWGMPMQRAEAATEAQLHRITAAAHDLGHDQVEELVAARTEQLLATLT